MGSRLRGALRADRGRPQDSRAHGQTERTAVRANRYGKRARLDSIHVNRKSAVIGATAIILSSVLLLSLAWGLQHAALAPPPLRGQLATQLAIQTAAGHQVRAWEMPGQPGVR